MNQRTLSGLTLAVIALAGCSSEGAEETPRAASGPAAKLAGDGVALTYEGESRLQNVRQLTAGGENDEA